MPNSTVIAVASAKGGVGKTTTSINLGTAIAAHGLDVVVVELDLAMANVVDFLSLDFDDENDPSMHDVLAGETPVTDAIYEAPGGASVVPSGTALDALGSIDMSHLSPALETLEDRFDVVVLDTGAGVNSATTTSVQVADQTLLVSTPRVASIRDTEKTRTIVEERGGEVGGLVLTQSGTGSSPGSERLTEFLGVDLLCTVPQDPIIHECQDAGVPVVERRPESEAARAYAEGAATIVESEFGVALPANSLSTGDDESPADAPSREALEAEGWTFPGDGADDADATESVSEPADVEPPEPDDGVTDAGGENLTNADGNTAEILTNANDADAISANTDDEGEIVTNADDEDGIPTNADGASEDADIETDDEDPDIVVADEDFGIAATDEENSDIVVAEERVPETDDEDDAGDSRTDAPDPKSISPDVQPLTTDGGDAALPDEAYGSASPEGVDFPTPSARFLEEMRSAREHVEGGPAESESPDQDDREPSAASEGDDDGDGFDDGDSFGDGFDDADDSDGSLADRVSSLFSRSE